MATPGVVQEVVSVAAEHAERVDTDCAFPAEAVDALRKTGLLGLVLPREIGGMGSGPVEFTEVVAQLSAACGSTAMIYLMHMAAAVTVAASPPPGLPDLLADMASGKQLGTLAFSEPGSRSHFWAPVSTASADGDGIAVRADKSWVTSAGFADVYVVSVGSADGAAGDVDLYAVPADTPGLRVAGTFTGMGLRGNASAPMAVDIRIPDSYRLGEAGGGFGIMMQTVLPGSISEMRLSHWVWRPQPPVPRSSTSGPPGWNTSVAAWPSCPRSAPRSLGWAPRWPRKRRTLRSPPTVSARPTTPP